ncbi:MAG: energy-coupling factor ABC transporter ATP-binding protein [Ruminococcus sp.]|nr:energy-coupling factor ABC transporter ATP-binding protein [Ruminococcus sp.]
MEILAVEDLTFSYPQCISPALRNASLRLERGELAVLCGATGSGKSTLLRMLKRELIPNGEMSGRVMFCGSPLGELSARDSASRIGFVMQRPEQQIVTDKVWHELAFGLENLGVPQEEIARRTAEIASYFGIISWYGSDTAELSGGQKQLLNLAAVLVMQPELLILDEPTAQLDPIAASEFISTLRKLNQELGITILLAEHRLEEAVPLCDRLIVMENGGITANGSPREVIASLRERPELLCGMPAASRLYAALDSGGECPLTVREGKEYIAAGFRNEIRSLPAAEKSSATETALEFRDVFFRYERQSPDVLSGLSLKIMKGELFCILGGNGSGKTTALSAAAGILRPYCGDIRIFGKKQKEYRNRSLYRECLAMLPQDVQTVFLRNTVREELDEAGADAAALPYDLSHLMDKHPYDLSGGEQQLTALAKVLAAKPKLLLLDEPTKGMDAATKQGIINVLKKLRDSGITVVAVTHDVEFAAVCADRCAMFFGGQIVSTGTPEDFFTANTFYTTAASRMARGIYDRTAVLDDVISLCRMNGRRED